MAETPSSNPQPTTHRDQEGFWIRSLARLEKRLAQDGPASKTHEAKQ